MTKLALATSGKREAKFVWNLLVLPYTTYTHIGYSALPLAASAAPPPPHAYTVLPSGQTTPCSCMSCTSFHGHTNLRVRYLSK